MPCSIQPYETPTIAPTTWLKWYADSNPWWKNEGTKTKPKSWKIPPKEPTHLTKNTTQNHTEKLEEGDWNVHWQDQTMTSSKSTQ